MIQRKFSVISLCIISFFVICITVIRSAGVSRYSFVYSTNGVSSEPSALTDGSDIGGIDEVDDSTAQELNFENQVGQDGIEEDGEQQEGEDSSQAISITSEDQAVTESTTDPEIVSENMNEVESNAKTEDEAESQIDIEADDVEQEDEPKEIETESENQVDASNSAKCSIDTAVSDNFEIRTALATYPRSGNSFFRTMIEKTTQLRTSSLYCDRYLRETFAQECNKSANFLVKTHYPVTSMKHFPDPQSHWKTFDRFIQLIRNPFDAIVSYHNYHKSFNHSKKINQEEFTKSLNPEKLYWYVHKYKSHFLYWDSVPIPSIRIRYEDLRFDTKFELQRAVKFLIDQEHDASDMIDCAMNDDKLPYQSVTQRDETFYGLKWLNRNQTQYIIQNLGDIICKIGYAEALNEILEIDDRIECEQYEANVDFQDKLQTMLEGK